MFLRAIFVAGLCSFALSLAPDRPPVLAAADFHSPQPAPAQPRGNGGIPANDPCTGAFFLPPGSDVVDSTIIAAPDAAPVCVVADSAPGVWYFTVGTGYQMTLTTCHPSTNYDTVLRVYCGTCAALTCVGGNDDQLGPDDPACDVLNIGINRGSTVTWCSQQGAVYYILVHGFGDASGGFGLELISHDDQPPCTGGVDCGGDVLGACCANEGLACTPSPMGYPSCGGSFSCGCFESTEGDGICVNFSQFCDAIGPCDSSADCPPGAACLANSACIEPSCALIDCVAPPLAANAPDNTLFIAHAAPQDFDSARGVTSQCLEISAETCAEFDATYHGDGTTCEDVPCCSAPDPAFDPQPPVGALAMPDMLSWNGGCPFGVVVEDSLLPSAYFDTWMFTAAPGTGIQISVDTVSTPTAFDPAFCLAEHPVSIGCMTFADDVFPCTFPPPAFSCPTATDILDPDADQQYFLTVFSASSGGNFAGPVGEYRLIISANGPICGLTLVADNRTEETSGLPRELLQTEKTKAFAPPLADTSTMKTEVQNAQFRNGVALSPAAGTSPRPTKVLAPPQPHARGNFLFDEIDFDDFTAPSTFAGTIRLTDRYAAQGVVFVGPGGLDGGAVLNEDGNFGITGHSAPNFLAFSTLSALADGGIPRGPETILFAPPVTYVSANFASSFSAGSELTVTAFAPDGSIVESDSLTLSTSMTFLDLSGPAIARVVISTSADIFVMDNLSWLQCRDIYTVAFGTTNPPLNLICSGTPIPYCDPGPLVNGTTYYWQVTTFNCCDLTTGPVWSFTAAPCPGEGDCCTPHSSPGCDNAECCSAVAAVNPDCATVEWDETCAALADEICGICPRACCAPTDACENPGGCGTFGFCEGDFNCFCAESVEGDPACIRNDFCGVTAECGSSAECAPGQVCAITCCEDNYCFERCDSSVPTAALGAPGAAGMTAAGLDAAQISQRGSFGPLPCLDVALAFCLDVSGTPGGPGSVCASTDCAACACGDFDGDNIVTLVDFITFQVCFGAVAPTVDCPPDAFSCADLDASGAVNLVDFITFQTLFGLTPDGVAPPDCLSVD